MEKTRFDIQQIRRNKKLFLNYNRLRMDHAFAQDPEKSAVAFEIIPVLLSVNEMDLPGYVSKGDYGCGVYGVGSSYRLRNVIQEYFPETKSNIPFQRYLVRKPLIESLFVLGSIGTVAQTDRSDFDFWVCVDEPKWPEQTLEALREKTQRISQWCQSTFNMDVHFFILDLEHIRRNDFGRVDEESSGSSQKNFLKEECYRTMLFVSGKVPFWWVVPSKLGQDDYEALWRAFSIEAPLDFVDFVDLGYLKDVSKTEFLGNALWQLSKGIKDPFKSMLKMAMMVMYLSNGFRGPLLCDVLKDRVLGGKRFFRELDPYLLMVERVLDFYEKEEDREAVELLRKAFYLKCNPMLTRAKRSTGYEYKSEVFKSLMRKWKWRLDQVEELNQIENWSYSKLLQFSKEINRFFFTSYRRLSEDLPPMEKQEITEYDLTVLGRKLFALFSQRKNKLQVTPFLTSKRVTLDRCVFQYEPRAQGKNRWVLYDASWYPTERNRNKQQIFSADRVVRAAAWLVNNGLYDIHRTTVEMVPNSTGVTLNDIIQLLKHIQSYFSPAYYFGQNGKAFYEMARMDKVMAILDMEEIEKQSENCVTLDIIYRNTWGELFTEVYPYMNGLQVLIEYIRQLRIKDQKDLSERFVLHLPESIRKLGISAKIYQEIYRAIGLEEDAAGQPFLLHYG